MARPAYLLPPSAVRPENLRLTLEFLHLLIAQKHRWGRRFRLPGIAMLEYQRGLPLGIVAVRSHGSAVIRALDRCTNGPLWLGQPRIAAMIAQAIQVGEAERQFYRMPNHVHFLVLPKKPLPVLMRWLKGGPTFPRTRRNHPLH
jgi:hypothetical protein